MKKFLASVMCLTMMATGSVSAFAASDVQTTTADLTAAGMVFDITVPASLPISVDSEGTVTCATTAVIENNTIAKVVVTDVTVTGSNDWSVVAFDTDFSKELVDLKQYGMKLNSSEVATTGAVPLADGNWPSIPGETTIPVLYDVNVAAQSTAVNQTIGSIQITVDWDVTG